MDPNALLQCFASTLEVQLAVRELAEAQLRELASTPGFLGACLDIIVANDAPAHCRKAAAVYFKNRIVRYWRDSDRIDNGEKPVLRERLLPVMCAVDWPTKHQLLPVLRVIVASDYPKVWPLLLNNVGELLQKQDNISELYTGIVCFAEICRSYRWIDNEERQGTLDPIIAQVFPHLLSISNAVLDTEFTEVSADVLKYILKCYKFVTYYDLPVVLQTKENLVAWCELHCRVISSEPPSYVSQGEPGQDSQTQVSRCYKWSVANIERLFRRYASKSLSSKFLYDGFKTLFVNDVLPHVMSIYLGLMEKWCRGERWLPNPTLYHLLEFLSHCVTQKESWKAIKPFFESIVSHFIYPLLCPSTETLELFETDPADYINSKLDSFDDSEPDVAALGLLVTLASKRTKSTMQPLVAFAYNQLAVLSQQAEDLEVAKKKDGALRLIGGVSHLLTQPDSPFFTQTPAFIKDLVLPNLSSKFEFLVARSMDVCARFADAPIEDPETLSVLFNGILSPFTSDSKNVSLPVSLQGALGIQAYIQHPQFQQILSNVILPTMLRLLELSNEIDNESVSMVMQECVENFSQQLQPFGADLMKNLVEQFLRLAAEVKEAVNVDADDVDIDALDSGLNDEINDKVVAAIGLLNTMITVLLSFENSREVCIHLEETFSPAIEYVLSNDLDDFLTEIGELIENSIFLLRSVTPVMWGHFSNLMRSFFHGVALMYADELFPCLKNYLVYGSEHLNSHPELATSFINLIELVSKGEEGDETYDEITQGLELAQTLILSLQHNSTPYVGQLCQIFLPVLARTVTDASHVKMSAMVVHSINFVVSCLVYGLSNTFTMLEQLQYLPTFFELWFTIMPKFKKVYDIKLSILGLVSLVNNPECLLVVPGGAAAIGTKLSLLFRELPAAIRNLEKQRKDFNAGEFDYDNAMFGNSGSYEEEDSDYEDEVAAGDEVGESGVLSEKALESIKQSGGFFTSFDDDEEVACEDFLGLSPLDEVDPFAIFKEFSTSLQVNNPALYEVVFNSLAESERQIFIDIFSVQS